MTFAKGEAGPISGTRLGRDGLRPPRDLMATVGGIGAVLAGGWLMVVPSALDFGVTARWNGLLVGALVLCFGAFLGLLGAHSLRLTGPLAVLGGWIVSASFVLPYGESAVWNQRVIGAFIVINALVPTVGAHRRSTNRT